MPLAVSRGDASLSFLHTLATRFLNYDSTLYMFTDSDGKGDQMFDILTEDLPKHHDCDATVVRAALTRDQIHRYHLPTRPAKPGDPFKTAVELDALPKARLQQLVADCIKRHVDAAEWTQHLEAEEADRDQLRRLAKRYHNRKEA